MFEAADGSRIHPTAGDVWALIFDAATSFRGQVVDQPPDKSLPHLRFSRFPAELVLIVTGALDSGIRLDLNARIDGATFPLVQTAERMWPNQLIENDSWYPIDLDLIADVTTALARHGITVGGPISLGQLIKLRTETDLPVAVLERAEVDPSATGHKRTTVHAPVEGLTGRLYPYQQDGVDFLKLVAAEGIGCIVGDEMGLGKTLQVIVLLLSESNAHRGPSLVVAPATLLENWRREIAQFAPRLTVLVHAGSNRPGQASKLTTFDVVVTSYETAVRDEPMLSSVAWNILAVDEAQSIRNPAAQRTLAIKRLPRRVSLAVTGTPVENRLSDLWSLSDFSLPGLLGGLTDFQTRYDENTSDATQLATIVSPILLRRRVADVAKDLPPRLDIPQCILMTRSLATDYEAVRQDVRAEYGAAAGLVSLQKLRMFCCHPVLLEAWGDGRIDEMPKFRRLVEILEEVFSRDEKALVFCSYTQMADLILDHLVNALPHGSFACIDGRTAISDRQPIVDRFTAFLGFGALVLNPKAAGVGLNITAANHVIHYNPEWNPAVEDQASARAYRRRQTKPVTVHHLYFASTVEEVIVDRLQSKRSLAEAAVTGHSGDGTTDDVLRALAISPISQIGSLE